MHQRTMITGNPWFVPKEWSYHLLYPSMLEGHHLLEGAGCRLQRMGCDPSALPNHGQSRGWNDGSCLGLSQYLEHQFDIASLYLYSYVPSRTALYQVKPTNRTGHESQAFSVK